uniref:Uncharacterized protein n=1 Tax=Escherichia coli TaxID=562 RepID=H9AXY4_ECOLX|nr:hypothetical protein ec14_12 [Escherichia coli]
MVVGCRVTSSGQSYQLRTGNRIKTRSHQSGFFTSGNNGALREFCDFAGGFGRENLRESAGQCRDKQTITRERKPRQRPDKSNDINFYCYQPVQT